MKVLAKFLRCTEPDQMFGDVATYKQTDQYVEIIEANGFETRIATSLIKAIVADGAVAEQC